MFPFPARPRIDVAEHCAADAADDVHEVGHVVPHKDDVIDLLAQIERRHQQHGDGDAAREAGQGCQHDEHEDNARRAQQRRAGEQRTLQNARDKGREQDAFEQGQAAVLFLHRRADDEEKQHIVQEMVPAAVAQHMAEEPDVKQRVFQRGTVDAEQMGGRPAAGVLAQEQHPQ